MANTLITSSMVAKESLRLLENNLVFARGANRQFEKEWDSDRKIGDTVNIRVPPRYSVRSGTAIAVQNFTESVVPLQLSYQKGVDVAFSSKDLALNLEDFSKQVLEPQIVQLANQIDFDGLQLASLIPRAVGTPGTTPSAMLTYASAGQNMDDESCPQDDKRYLLLNSLAQVTIIDSLKGLFQSAEQIKKQYERGMMGTAAGFEWAMSQNIPVHTIGALGGTPVVNGAGQTGSSLATSGWSNSVSGLLNVGDVFTIAGVYSVNPLSKQSTTQLRQFVVTAAASSNGSGQATLSIYPAIVTSGATQNVTAGPANSAAITVLGSAGVSTPMNLAYHKDAFAMAAAELPLPKGMDMAARASSKEAGLSIRFIRGYDIMNDLFVSRLDVLYGWALVRPEFACRIQG